jgi:hypothetical protein
LETVTSPILIAAKYNCRVYVFSSANPPYFFLVFPKIGRIGGFLHGCFPKIKIWTFGKTQHVVGQDWIRRIGFFARLLNTIGKTRNRKLTNLLTKTIHKDTCSESLQKRTTITNKLADGSTKVSTIYEDGRELTATYAAEQTIKPIAPIKLAHHHALSDEEKLALHKMIQFDKSTATIPNAFISLSFNRKSTDQDYATDQLKLFYKRMQEITFGQNWESAVLKQRNSNSLDTRRNVLGAPAHFVMENVDSNLHWHGVMFLTKQHYSRLKLKAKKHSDGEGAPILHERLAQVWRSMNPAGTMTLRRIAASTLSRDTYYLIKRLNTLSDYQSKYVVAPHFDR